ncbi:hypothetical protein AAG906_019130 [Vitis piasezkii]
MCRGDEHLAWKCLVSSEACRGLFDQFTTTMASIQETLANLKHEIDSQHPMIHCHLHHHHLVRQCHKPHLIFYMLGMILRVIRGLIRDPRGKELTLEGAAWLMDLDGNRFLEPTNVDQLKKYYV